MKVYLSGGMKGDWQDRIKAAAPALVYLDPREHGLTEAADYVKRDLEMVKEADLIVAYLEASNPSGIGLSAEMGYAKALEKEIFLVCEKMEHKWNFIRALATLELRNFEDLVAELRCRQ